MDEDSGVKLGHERVIQEILPDTLKSDSGEDDPWLFFYEFFLAKYDPKLRKEWGVYYTPVEVVRCQVSLIDEILSRELGRAMGFVEPGVVTLDPGLGTGTYLLGIIDHSLWRVEEEEGRGAVRGGARSLANNLHGFEMKPEMRPPFPGNPPKIRRNYLSVLRDLDIVSWRFSMIS